jgi:hypothetical protein
MMQKSVNKSVETDACSNCSVMMVTQLMVMDARQIVDWKISSNAIMGQKTISHNVYTWDTSK